MLVSASPTVVQTPIVVLISGSGSNMEALIKASRRSAWRDRFGAEIVSVISNRPQAAGLAKAADLGVRTACLAHQDFDGREAYDHALQALIETQLGAASPPPLLLLAGFMRILTPGFVARHSGRMLNIHPSLLPAFPGLNTHQRAIDMGCRVAGATVHEVNAELDHGRIWAQAVVPILPGDQASHLAARVLSQEHRIYVEAVEAWLHACGSAA